MDNASIKDDLTGVYNYTYFLNKVKQEIDGSNRFSKPFSIARLDIDNFKNINDIHGFDFGNHIIKQVADLCKNSTRAYDVIAREKGEEFVIMLPEVALKDAMNFAERIRKKIEIKEDFGNKEKQIRLTVSMGVVTYTRKESMDLHQLIQLLDTAVYQAKQDGRNCVVPYTSFLPPEDNFL